MNKLTDMVDQLLKENRDLKRALARAGSSKGDGALGAATKTLAGLQRRVSRALSSDGTAGRGRRRAATATPTPTRTRRKVTDPEVLGRRRAALAKARAARSERRAAAKAGEDTQG